MHGGTILRDYRIEHGLSQRQLAKRLGMWRETIAAYEGGKLIGRRALPKIVQVTGLSGAALRPDLAALFKEAAQ